MKIFKFCLIREISLYVMQNCFDFGGRSIVNFVGRGERNVKFVCLKVGFFYVL